MLVLENIENLRAIYRTRIDRRMRYSNSEFDAIVQLSGGFGNQLFQYAFGMQLEAVHGRWVGYDVEFYKAPNSIAHNRLRLIEYGFDLPTVPELPRGYRTARRLKWLPSSVQQALAGLTYLKCPATRYASVPPTSGRTYFAGLWHSPRYFEAIDREVRTEFRSRLLAASDQDGGLRTGTVGFHVRRGDYLSHALSHNLDYVAYMSAACAKLIALTGKSDWSISVYTDDPDWCEANLKLPKITINRGGGMLEDFIGLMQCEHKVVSNSTFAWWAAFLGEAEDGLVFAPKRWHATADSSEAQILRKGWIVVDH